MKPLTYILILLLPAFALAKIQLISSDQKSVIVEYSLDGMSEQNIDYNGTQYSVLNLGEGDIPSLPGYPALPEFNAQIAIPEGATVTYQILHDDQQSRSNIDIFPVSYPDLSENIYFEDEIYQSAALYPQNILTLQETENFRNVNILPFKICPIQYSPVGHSIIIHQKIRIKFIFSKSGKALGLNRISKWEKDLFKAQILNYTDAENYQVSKPQSLRRINVNYDFNDGKWYKLPITEEGIYQITGSQLKDAGYDIPNLLTSDFHIYNYGGYALPYSVSDPRPGDLNEIAIKVVDVDGDGLFDEEDKAIFYGKGLGGWSFNDTPGIYRWEYNGHPRSSNFG